jgi:hypothetical protein
MSARFRMRCCHDGCTAHAYRPIVLARRHAGWWPPLALPAGWVAVGHLRFPWPRVLCPDHAAEVS